MEYEHITHSFKPVYDENSRILILGTLPSVKSRDVNAAYPPPTVVVITSTPGATRSGFTIFVSLVNPLPEKSAYANVLASYAPTDIARLAEDGIVSVVASVGNKNPVPRFNTLSLGSHISYCPVTIFPALRTILHIPSVR